jgi:hypothetical protein
MYRKKGYIIARIVGLLAVLLMAFLVAIQTPLVQTRLSKVGLNQLVAIMDGRVQYDELKVMTSGVIVIRNLKLIDTHPYTEDVNGRGWAPADTVAHIDKLTATFSLTGLFRKEGLHMGRVTIEGGSFHMVSEPGEEYHDNLSRIFHLQASDAPPSRDKLFDIKKLRIKDFRFRMNSFLPDHGTYKGFGVNFDDLDITLDLTAYKFAIADAKIRGDIERLSAREKSGYVIQHLTSSCEFGFVDGALFEDFVLRDAWSDIHLRALALQYESTKDLGDFVNVVPLEGDLQRSRVALQTLAYFSGTFIDSPTVMEIRRGHVEGPVRDLTVERLIFNETYSGVSATANAHIIGLPDIQEATLDAQLQDLTGTTTAFSRFLGGLTPDKPAPDFSQIAHNVPLTLQVEATGPFNDLDLDIETQSPSGSFNLTGSIRNAVDPVRPIELALNLATHELDLGDILGVDILGTATLHTRVHAVLADGGGLPDATLDSLIIDRIHALGHDIHNIRLTGSLQDGTAAGRIQSSDPLLRLDLTGLADLTPKNGRARYRVDGQIADANLAALGFDAGGKLSRAATNLHADLVRLGERFDGSVRLEDVRLTDKEGAHQLGDIQVNARTDGSWQEIDFNAPFLEARFQGDRPVTQFARDLQEITVRRDLTALFTNEFEQQGCGNYSLDAIFHDTREILAVFAPGAYIADNTDFSLTTTDEGRLNGRVSSDRIAFGKNYLRNVDLLFDNRNGALLANVISSELRAGTLAVLNPAITLGADDNLLSLGVHYDDFSGTGGEATVNLEGRMFRDEDDGELVIQAHPVGSYIMAGEETWSFAPADIIKHGQDIRLDHFLISNGAQQLLVDGGFSSRRSDTLSLHMDRFDLALVNQFLPAQFGLEGLMNGQATVTSGPNKALGMIMDFRLDTLRLSGVDAGNMTLSSQWQNEGKELGISLVDHIDGRDALRVGGSYFLQEKRLDLQAGLERFPLAVASAFLPDAITELNGGISGHVSLTGPMDDLVPHSDDLYLDDAYALVGLTGVGYTLSGPIRVDQNGVTLEHVAVRDDDGGSMTVDGGLLYQHLKDFSVDARVALSNLKVLDAPERPGVSYYGYLRASGTANARGPLTALTMDADISTSGDGEVHISPSASAGSASSSSHQLLTFTEPRRELDPYEEMLASLKKKEVTPADITIRGRVNIQPAVRALVEIDKEAGNVAAVSGQGTVTLTLRPSRAIFDLNGDYNISEGTYQFVLPGLLSKNFTVQRGSSVKFNGDVMNTELDINATYGLRASLDPMLGTGNLSRRPVDCVINVGDRLRAPKLNLSIDVPDLDPTTRMAVESALSTSDKVQKQFVSLLLLGTFLPDENSGVFNQTALLYSNVMEIMSGQLNNILQRFKIPVDVGFGYQEMRTGENLFDVSVSTELFDSRVILSGNFGNRQYSTGSAGGDFSGDVDLQVRLDEEGKFRLTVFSHSADEFTSYLDFSQRNGIGVSFQKEYKSFADFTRSLFIPRKKRAQLDELEAEKFAEQVIINIEDESGETVPDSDTAR